MKKILVVLTGGTIASAADENVIGITDESRYKLVSEYEKEYGRETEFDIISPLNILSENLMPHMWNTLFNTLFTTDLSRYGGIIITHGTDTLSYTSAMAGFMLGYLNMPVVLVASGKPIGEEGSNGLVNFRNAVCLINRGITGVFTVFSDIYGANNVYLSTRLLEADRYNDNFLPFGNVPYGIMKNERFVKCEDRINDFELKPIDKICEKLDLKNKIMIINPYPGLDYDAIQTDGFKAVLHTLYHSATANENGLKAFAKRCESTDTGLYLCCFKNGEKTVYSSMKSVLASSAVPIFNISKESAYAKLLIAYNTDKNAEEFMRTNIYHEILL